MLKTIDPSTDLDFGRLVPGALVHRRQLGDVLITDGLSTGPDSYLCGIHWPSNHLLLGGKAITNSAFVAEAVRQVTIYLSHQTFDVPIGHQGIMSALNFRISREPDGLDSDSPITARVHVDEIRRSRAVMKSLVARVDLRIADNPFASGAGHARFVTPDAYERVRSTTRADRALAPSGQGNEEWRALPGISLPGLGVLSATTDPHTFYVLVNPHNRAYFDHPLDHVPGMLLVEATRQAIRQVVGDTTLEIVDFEMQFTGMVELSSATSVRVFPGSDRGEFHVTVEQNGQVRAAARCRT